MAVTGKFEADFSSFHKAVEDSIVKFRGFEAGVASVEGKLNKMVDSFSGRKVISEATLMAEAVERIGGTSKLTQSEIARVGAVAAEAAAKFRAWGQDVPVGIQKLADSVKDVGTAAKGSTSLLSGMAGQLAGMFTIGAVIAFGRGVLAAGDNIQKMADQTSLGTDEVQKLMYIAGQSGTSIESLVGAVQNLQQRLGDENSGAAGAMAKLGINMEAFNKLGTYQQMLTLAAAIKDVHDPTEQASLAAAIFGKTWKEILPAIKSGMADVAEQAPIMADSTVQSLDRIGDAQTRAKQQATAWGGAFVLAIEGAGYSLGNFLSLFDPSHFGRANDYLLKMEGALNDKTGIAGALSKVKAPAVAVGAAIQALGMKAADATRIENALTESAKTSIAVHTKSAETHKKLTEELAKGTDAAHKLEAGFFGLTTSVGVLDSREIDALKDMIKVREEIDKLEQSAHIANFGFKGMADGLEHVGQKVELFATAIHTLGSDISGNLTTALANIPNLLMAAFTGGGGLMGAIKAIGVQLATAILAPIEAGLSKAQKAAVGFGTAASGAIGQAAGLGTTANMVIGVGTGLAGAAVAASAWGTAMAAGGVAGSVALGAATLGIGAAAVGVALLVKHWWSHRKAVQESTKEINNFQQQIWATLKPAQVVESGGRQWAATVIGVRDAYLATGRSAAQAEIDVKALWDAAQKGAAATAAAMAKINEAFIEQKIDAEDLAKAVEKYGFTLEELGPAMQRQQLDAQAKELLNDWRLLVGSGIDLAVVNERMAGEMNKYLVLARKTGMEVPIAMKPILQSMIQQGTLLDENGVAVTDLGALGLTFSETMTAGFDRVVAKLTELLNKIGMVPAAIAAIPRDVNVHVGYDYDSYNPPGPDNYAAQGGLVTQHGIVPLQYLAGGGNVLSFRPRGTDRVPAMLTPGEMVLTKAQQARLLNRGGGGANVMNFQELRDDMRKMAREQANDRRRLPERLAIALAGVRR